jgi:hypothetical protein
MRQMGGGLRHSQKMDRLVAERVALGPVTTPIPSKAIDWRPPTALSVMVIDAVRGPTLVGMNVVLIVHLSRGARLRPQLWVRVKSAAFALVMAMLLTFIGCVPTLVSVPSGGHCLS